jgi:hypothetical protein
VGDGQVIRIRLSQDSVGGRTVSWDTAYDFGSTGGTLSKWCSLGAAAVWLLPHVAGAATFVRVDASAPDPGGPLGMFAYEVAGLGTAPQLDPAGGVASATGYSDRLDSGTCPPIAQSPEIIFGFGHIYHVTLSAPPGGWTTMIGGGVENFWSGYQIASTPGGAYDWSQSAQTTGSWGAGVTAICAQPTPPAPGSGLLMAGLP